MKEWLKEHKKASIIVGSIIVVVILGIIGFLIYDQAVVYKNCTIEAGVEYSVADFLKQPDENASISERSDNIDITVPGKYTVYVKKGIFEHKISLTIQDTIPPEYSVNPRISGYGTEIEAKEFVTDLVDATDVTFTYETAPDFTKLDDQTVVIIGTDMGGNKVSKETTLTIWPVVFNIVKEAGEEAPSLKELILDSRIDINSAKLLTKAKDINMNTVGDTPLKVTVANHEYDITLTVKDTVPPEVSFQDAEGYTHGGKAPEAFIKSCKDVTKVTYKFEGQPDFLKEGTQEVTVIATDEGGNEVKGTAKMTLQVDNEAPVISGGDDQTVFLGYPVSYRSFVSASDNCPEGFKFTIDSSAVNINVVGDYPVNCLAVDASGNRAEKSFTVHVMKRTYSAGEVYGMAAAALSRCGGGSKADTVSGIFHYLRGNMSFYDNTAHDDSNQMAGEGFERHRGDCYTYAYMASAMLSAAGISNTIITNGNHMWNLVDIDDGHGWYHFDTTPFAGRRESIILWDDAQLTEYSNRYGTHSYDHGAYSVP